MLTAMDNMLKTIERQADAVNFRIDTHTEWIWMNEFATRLQFGEPTTMSDKTHFIDMAQAFCLVLGLNYRELLNECVKKAWA